MKRAILIVGHGSRSKDAQNIFNEIVQIVKDKASYDIVEGAHMELCDPSIPNVVEKMVQKQVQEILVVPYFLYEGIHIKEDIPEIIEELSKKYNGLKFKMARPIGAEPMLADILIERAREII